MNRHSVFAPSGLSRRAVLGRAAATGAALGLTTRLGPAAAQEGTPTSAAAPLTVQQVSLAQARTAIDAALADAETRGLRMVVAVVDAGANLVALARMDGAWLASLDVAIKKARTSALLQAPTAALGPVVQPAGRSTGPRSPTRG